MARAIALEGVPEAPAETRARPEFNGPFIDVTTFNDRAADVYRRWLDASSGRIYEQVRHTDTGVWRLVVE